MCKLNRPSTPTRIFGARVRAARHERGWSIEQLGDSAELHWTYVGSVERGERNISLLNILRLAASLEVDPGELVKDIPP